MILAFTSPTIPLARAADARMDILSPGEWAALDQSIQRALTWLAAQQQVDGSFTTHPIGQPGVTSLAIMAFLADGYVPGSGPYGESIDRAIDYVLQTQQADGRLSVGDDYTGNYNNAIAGLMLTEVYGMLEGSRAAQVHDAIVRALGFARQQQMIPKFVPDEQGAWRYTPPMDNPKDSDLSVTSWQLKFMRSARNAGFEVPSQYIDEAMNYVERCFDPDRGTFIYGLYEGMRLAGRGMAGAGILAFAMAGRHGDPQMISAGEYVLRTPFEPYNGGSDSQNDQYHYAVYNCCMAMFQLGGHYWDEFFPRVVRVLLANQSPEGCWGPEVLAARQFGQTYATAITVLGLCAPNQLLPIYQR
jgi:hypothetical protein